MICTKIYNIYNRMTFLQKRDIDIISSKFGFGVFHWLIIKKSDPIEIYNKFYIELGKNKYIQVSYNNIIHPKDSLRYIVVNIIGTTINYNLYLDNPSNSKFITYSQLVSEGRIYIDDTRISLNDTLSTYKIPPPLQLAVQQTPVSLPQHLGFHPMIDPPHHVPANSLSSSASAASQQKVLIALDFDKTIASKHSNGFAMYKYIKYRLESFDSESKKEFFVSHINKRYPSRYNLDDIQSLRFSGPVMTEDEIRLLREHINSWNALGHTVIILSRSVDTQLIDYFKEVFPDLNGKYEIIAPSDQEYRSVNINEYWGKWKADQLQIKQRETQQFCVFVDDTPANILFMQYIPNILACYKPGDRDIRDTYTIVDLFLTEINNENFRGLLESHSLKKYITQTFII